MKKALITGVTGQDGSYLAELLLGKGYEVHGLIRRSSSFNTGRVIDIFEEPFTKGQKFFLHYADLEDASRLTNLIGSVKPDEIYNLAAQSHVKVSFDIPDYTGVVTGLGSIRILEAIRANDLEVKFYQASSSELFGSTPPPQNENTKFHPRSPYAVAKLYAYWSTVNYREAYGIHASNGILFNHESPRRGETFVTKKIAKAAARIAFGQQNELRLGNLDAIRDWGYAPEYVEAMWRMLQMPAGSDYVIATGKSATVEDFLNECFSYFNLEASEFVIQDDRYLRPTEVDALIGDPSKAEKELGWTANTDWRELAKIMCKHEEKLLNV
jgi:GDPmannose 4,6-dehydratase